MKLKIILLLIFFIALGQAVMKHSEDTRAEFNKYRALVNDYPKDKRYLFEYAMVLAYMGKIEIAGDRLKQINDMDDAYAPKILKIYEDPKSKIPDDWKKDFKLGFVYYFLYEEANGRIELANRRIKRIKERPGEYPEGTIDMERAIRREKQPLADNYKDKALSHFEKVAEKEPEDSINAWGYAYMAVVRAIEKDWPEAQKLCEKALEIEPDAYAIRAAYMEALKQNGNYFGAAIQMSTALNLKSEQDEYEKELFGDEIK